jgi:hypothetical protein
VEGGDDSPLEGVSTAPRRRGTRTPREQELTRNAWDNSPKAGTKKLPPPSAQRIQSYRRAACPPATGAWEGFHPPLPCTAAGWAPRGCRTIRSTNRARCLRGSKAGERVGGGDGGGGGRIKELPVNKPRPCVPRSNAPTRRASRKTLHGKHALPPRSPKGSPGRRPPCAHGGSRRARPSPSRTPAARAPPPPPARNTCRVTTHPLPPPGASPGRRAPTDLQVQVPTGHAGQACHHRPERRCQRGVVAVGGVVALVPVVAAAPRRAQAHHYVQVALHGKGQERARKRMRYAGEEEERKGKGHRGNSAGWGGWGWAGGGVRRVLQSVRQADPLTTCTARMTRPAAT